MSPIESNRQKDNGASGTTPGTTTMPMRNCDTCGVELTRAEPFAVCLKCLFGTALSAREEAEQPAAEGDPQGPAGKSGLFARRDFFKKYEILERVAEGGQGDIWKVWDVELRRCLAMKRLAKYALGSPPAVYRFLAEAQIASQLEHPGILPIFDVGLDPDGRPFYTTQLLPGTTFRDIWEKVHDPAQPEWTIARAAELLIRVCDIIAHAHSRGVIHRDLKPANILVGAFSDVRVIDWGSAHVIPEARKAFQESFGALNRQAVDTDRSQAASTESSPLATARAGQPITLLFTPPEVLLGYNDQLGPETDVYAVGVMLYELLAGRPPYANTDGSIPETAELRDRILRTAPAPLRKVKRGVSRDLAAVCHKAIAHSKADRYHTAEELGADLRAFLEVRPVDARAPGPFLKFHKWAQRHIGPVLLASGALLTVTCSFFVVHGLAAERDAARQVAALESAERAARSGQWRAALRHWQEAESAGYPDMVQLGLRRAEAWTILSSPRRSRAELDKLARHPDPAARRAVVMLRIGEHQLFEKTSAIEGAQRVRQALAAGLSGADRPFAQGLLADSTPQALQLFREALQFDPYHHSAHRHSLGLEFTLGRHQELETHARVFRVLFPDDPSPGFLEASAFAARGRLAEAQASLARLRDASDPELQPRMAASMEVWASAGRRYNIESTLDQPDATNSFNLPSDLADFAFSPPNLTAQDNQAGPRLAYLPCLQRYLEGVDALKGLLLPGLVDPALPAQKIKATWQQHPEALLPAFAGTLLDTWHLPGRPKAPTLLRLQADLFQMAADSTSIIPSLPRWARYHAARTQLELAQSADTNSVRQCIENIQRVALEPDLLIAECRAYLEMALEVSNHDLARALLARWEREQPRDAGALRSRIRLDIATGSLGDAFAHIDALLATNPADAWALEQKEIAAREIRKLATLASAPQRAIDQ